MTTFTDNLTIKQIKQQAASIAETLAVPQFWLTDWLLYVIDKPSLFLMTDESYQLTDSESAKFNAGIKKMQQGIPLAYLTGHQAFWSLDFKVNAHTLIPRPDTEVLVEQVLEWIENNPIANHKASKRLLDLGTGSGCIAISLAHELARSSWQVIAVDVSAEALSVAQQNASDNQVDNVEFIQSSWYEALPSDAIQRFEIIVSNPPYIDEADEHLQGLKAEPISALSAPNKGLADIEHIVEQAPNYLQQGGLLAIEHGYDQGEAVRALFAANGFEAIKTAKDYGGNERVTLGQLK
ncbi:peptide chain release factor N(5)-glutamine methyltransferase [uncultured Psychrobacter sp.]|uniref:peptide chain release factor N(5)-glutamine methyltransferase n=1 Tax=uncultured Psychrobacter sp. TaxID=259303 RepID=UPI00261CA404|nr:peptide chain release factor N(5)-glutamine methyltransferase [uncultured Psychrobacter sp.]